MKFSAAIASLAIGAACVQAAPVDAFDERAAPPPAPAANLPGLNAAQSAHANAIIGEVKKENLGKQGCLAGIATGLTEASMLVYANSNVPASLNIPHDAVGSDHDSVGIFQQRVSVYPNVNADMDPAQSSAQFFAKMVKIAGWQTMDVGTLCQKVQVSAYPDRYNQHLAAAQSICSAGGFP